MTQPAAGLESKSGSDPGLRRRIRRSQRRHRIVSHLLVAPVLLFILSFFIGPIAAMLTRAVDNPEVSAGLPATAAAISRWDGEGAPPPAVFRALTEDFSNKDLRFERASAAQRLNYEIAGYRSLVMQSARKIGRMDAAALEDPKAALVKVDERWAEPAYWHALRRASGAYTPYYLLAALDLKMTDDGAVARAEPEQRIFVEILMRSLWVSAVVTAVCLLVGFPVANFMVVASPRLRAIIALSILLPFWTSLLVRTSAWIVVLQREGLINELLMWLTLIDDPLELVFNRFGVYVAMVHILLPFMVLPLYSVMKGISPAYMRAATSLGAHPARAFLRVYLPMTMPGVGAGCLLVFILTVGYYITPALVGGAKDQMIGYFIAFFTNQQLNWGMASALSFIALTCIIVLYAAVGRYVGVGRLAGLEK
ncbi:ABC transporter permease [Pikeienuella sp. HZG-20]|uniref:ABC transporter permease n=1 Tax=Paludibacillus litoralis TaxID=3133267 RepID=UPI0030ED9F02